MAVIPSPFVPAGAPVGPAGGDLKGSYPSPQIASATHLVGAATSTAMIDTSVTGDTMARYNVNADGGMSWGAGTGATDTNLYRAFTNILQTDSRFQAGGAVAAANLVMNAGAAPSATANAMTLYSPDGLAIGIVNKNGVVANLTLPQNATVTPVTVANTTTETVVATLTVPANTVAANSGFTGFTTGFLSTPATGTPAVTARLRIGGLSGAIIATASLTLTNSQTNVGFFLDYFAGVVTSGVSGTWTGAIVDVDVLAGPNVNVSVATSPVTQDTTITNALVLTMQWSAAVAGNTLTCNQSSMRQFN